MLLKSRTAETPEYDPRYERAQTLEGAKARYADPDRQYTLGDLERDLQRLLTDGENPDKVPLLNGATMYR